MPYFPKATLPGVFRLAGNPPTVLPPLQPVSFTHIKISILTANKHPP